MFPWNYGFHWSVGTVIFMGAFYTVLVIVAITLIFAVLRSRRVLATNREEEVRWHSDFHDLPASDRVCRHVLTGEFRKRECPNGFDCRKCETHAKLCRLHPAATMAGTQDFFGLDFPLNRLYHRGHTWVKQEKDGTVTVGVDDLGRRLLGAPDSVELPKPGDRVRTNGTAFRVNRRGGDVRLLSPVDGVVVETGGADRDFYLKVKPLEGGFDLRHLLSGSEIRPWLMRELERLQLSISTLGGEQTLADGGVPVGDLAGTCPKIDWDAVCGEMFLHP